MGEQGDQDLDEEKIAASNEKSKGKEKSRAKDDGARSASSGKRRKASPKLKSKSGDLARVLRLSASDREEEDDDDNLQQVPLQGVPNPARVSKSLKRALFKSEKAVVLSRFDDLPDNLQLMLGQEMSDFDRNSEAEANFFDDYGTIDDILANPDLKDGMPPDANAPDSMTYRGAVLKQMQAHINDINRRVQTAMTSLAAADAEDNWDDLAETAAREVAGKKVKTAEARALEAQQALFQARLVAEAMRAHVPEAILAQNSARLSDRLDDLMLNKKAKKRELRELRKTPTDDERAAERRPFDLIAERHSTTDAAHLDVFAQQLLHAPSATDRARIKDATDAAIARAERLLDLGGNMDDVEATLEHIPRAFWPPRFVDEIQAWRKVERELADQRIQTYMEQAAPPKIGKMETTEDVVKFVSTYFDDVMTFLNANEGTIGDDNQDWSNTEWVNYGIYNVKNLIDSVNAIRELDRDDPEFKDKLGTAIATATKSISDGIRNVSNCSKELTDAMSWAAGLGILSECIDIGMEVRDLVRTTSLKSTTSAELIGMANLESRGQRIDKGMENALWNEVDARALQQKKQAVNIAAHTVAAAGYAADFGGVGTPIKAVGKCIEYGGRVVFANIDFNNIQTAKKTIEAARAGSVPAQLEVMRNSALYAKSYIAIKALETPPDRVAMEFIVRRGYSEADLEKEDVTVQILAQAMMDHADQSDETQAGDSRAAAIADGLTDGRGGRIFGAIKGKLDARKERKTEDKHRVQVERPLKYAPQDLTLTDAGWAGLVSKMQAANVYVNPAQGAIAKSMAKVSSNIAQLGYAKRQVSRQFMKALLVKHPNPDGLKATMVKVRNALLQLASDMRAYTPMTTTPLADKKAPIPDDKVPVAKPHDTAAQAIADYVQAITSQVAEIDALLKETGYVNEAWEPPGADSLEKIAEARHALQYDAGLDKAGRKAQRKTLDKEQQKAEAALPLEASSFGSVYDAYAKALRLPEGRSTLVDDSEGDDRAAISAVLKKVEAAWAAYQAQDGEPDKDAPAPSKMKDTKNAPAQLKLARGEEAKAALVRLMDLLNQLRPGCANEGMRRYVDHLMETSRLRLREIFADQTARTADYKAKLPKRATMDVQSLDTVLKDAAKEGALDAWSPTISAMREAMKSREVNFAAYGADKLPDAGTVPGPENYGSKGRMKDKVMQASLRAMHSSIGEVLSSDILPPDIQKYLKKQLKLVEDESNAIADRVKAVEFDLVPLPAKGLPAKEDFVSTCNNAYHAGAVDSSTNVLKVGSALADFEKAQAAWQKALGQESTEKQRKALSKAARKYWAAIDIAQGGIAKLMHAKGFAQNKAMEDYLTEIANALEELRKELEQRSVAESDAALKALNEVFKQAKKDKLSLDSEEVVREEIETALARRKSAALAVGGMDLENEVPGRKAARIAEKERIDFEKAIAEAHAEVSKLDRTDEKRKHFLAQIDKLIADLDAAYLEMFSKGALNNLARGLVNKRK